MLTKLFLSLSLSPSVCLSVCLFQYILIRFSPVLERGAREERILERGEKVN